jgi:hypothetical protein
MLYFKFADGTKISQFLHSLKINDDFDLMSICENMNSFICKNGIDYDSDNSDGEYAAFESGISFAVANKGSNFYRITWFKISETDDETEDIFRHDGDSELIIYFAGKSEDEIIEQLKNYAAKILKKDGKDSIDEIAKDL